jgi:hypothetical protein
MTHIALVWLIQMLKVAVGGTTSPLDALRALVVKGLRCCSSYAFSSFLRYFLLA